MATHFSVISTASFSVAKHDSIVVDAGIVGSDWHFNLTFDPAHHLAPVAIHALEVPAGTPTPADDASIQALIASGATHLHVDAAASGSYVINLSSFLPGTHELVSALESQSS
jgi:hypothetical protein